MNQVKRCFELSGPVFSSPWLPVEEGLALGVAQAVEQDVCGYKHGLVAKPEQSVDMVTHTYDTRFRSRRTSAAASLSHDDTSSASLSEGSLAFGGSSQSFCNEDASSPKGYGRERDRGAARRLARREQSPVRDEEFLPRPEVLAGSHSDVDVESVEKTPSGRHDTVTLPPIFDRIRPVLYQVVSTGWGSGVILEAEDLFTVGRDRRDLHCIILDQHAVNVYDVKPSRQALSNLSAALAQSRIPRTTALENNSAYFFGAARFVFASPDTLQYPVYGLVLGLIHRRNRVTHLRAVFEGVPDAVSFTPTICDFRLDEAHEDQSLSARTRYNVSSAMRFSGPLRVSTFVVFSRCTQERLSYPCGRYAQPKKTSSGLPTERGLLKITVVSRT
ncbi:hypothetical protein RB195_008146 [Necator americanus]|uniref:Uncharacterized protein n=1 Tax=Necator americanus TaxID=51031 RepID=A0ABR1CM89_NECAM